MKFTRHAPRQSEKFLSFEVENLEDRLMLSTIQVFAAGQTGEETITLSIGGQVAQTFTNVGGNYTDGTFQTLSYTTPATVTPGQVRISFTNDGLTSTGADRNLRLQKIRIDGVDHFASDPSVFVDGTWISGVGCTSGNLETEYLHCGGYFQFADPATTGTTIIVRAAGATGTEQVKLKIDGVAVRTWNNVAGNYTTGVFQNLSYISATPVTIQQVMIEYSNDGLTSTGADRNLRVDSVAIDGVVYQAEGPTVYSDGHYVDGVGCSAGFLQTETLECGGYFDFNTAAHTAGGLKLSTTSIRVNESTPSVTVVVQRTGGSTGVVSVDYRSFSTTAIAGEDFTSVSGTLVFADGQTSKSFTISIINDTLVEAEEQFAVTIDNPQGGATLLSPRTLAVIIEDNDQPNTNPLLAHWRFDETTIGTAINSAAANLNGLHKNMVAPSGPTAESPLLNSPNATALNFDGVNDYVKVNSKTGLAFTTNRFSISMWIRPTFTDNAVHGLFYGGNTHYPNVYVFQKNKIGVRFGDGTTARTLKSASVLATNKWNLVTTTFDGTRFRIYVDGQLKRNSNGAAGLQVAAPKLTTTIGRRGSKYFKGQIDDVQIYDKSLTAAQVGNLYTPQTTVTSTVVTTLPGTVAIDWTPDGSKMFLGDFAGVVRVYEGDQLLPTPFIDISAQVNGTRGMLDIAVHPDFPTQPYLYLAFAYDPPEVYQYTGLAGPDGAGNRASRVIRVTADVATNYRTVKANSEVVLLGKNSVWQYYNGFVDSTVDFDEPQGGVLPNGNYVQDFLAADSTTHTINDLEFGPDGALYVSNGDGASYNQVDPRAVRVQDLNSLSGKILRIDPITGKGFADNPFYNGNLNANRSKVYQYGFRNPYRMAFDNATGKLYVGDVGWYQYEEINSGPAGANFGWPFYEGGIGNAPLKTISYQDLPEAIAFYASGQQTLGGLLSLNHTSDNIDALIVGDFYDGGQYGAEYEGDLFFNYLAAGTIKHVSFNANGSVASVNTFADDAGYIVQMKVGIDGYLYSVDLGSGAIRRWNVV
jgi:glucose/arabinose dehydrogenase